jgi:CheY-like chemotaxis protein
MRRERSGQSLAGLRVLLVEDNEDIRNVLSSLLRIEGVDVRPAESAHAALDIAAGWEFDVLLTDLGLPDVGGDDLITAILAMKNDRPRVVVVTGFGEPFAGRARDAGADVVLTKPLDWSKLWGHLGAADEALAA